MKPIYNLPPLDDMPRVSRQELCDRLDDILDHIDREEVAYVIQNDQGRDEAVLCPARWFDIELKSDLFEDDQNDDIKKHPPKQVQDEISS